MCVTCSRRRYADRRPIPLLPHQLGGHWLRHGLFGLFVRSKRVFHDFAFRPMGIYKVAAFGIKHFGLTLCFLADSFEDSSNLYGEWSVMCQSIAFLIGIRATDGNLLYLSIFSGSVLSVFFSNTMDSRDACRATASLASFSTYRQLRQGLFDREHRTDR